LAQRTAIQDKKRKRKAGIRKVLLMLGEALTSKDRRGFNAEDKVEDALGYFKKKKIIREYRRFPRFGPDDKDGKDFLVELLDGRTLFIDVKNHRWYWSDEQEATAKNVHLLTIWEPDEKDAVREKVLQLLLSVYFSGLNLDKTRSIISSILQKKKEKSFWRKIFRT